MPGNVTPRAEFGAGGTTVRPDRLVDGITKWGLIPTYLAVATFAIFQPMGKIDIPLPPGHNHYLLIGVTGAAIYGAFDLWRAFRPGGVSFIRLSTKGFEMSQGSSSIDGDWDDVMAMTDRRPGKNPPFRAILFVESRDGRIGMQVLDPYTPHGEAMRNLVRFLLDQCGPAQRYDGCQDSRKPRPARERTYLALDVARDPAPSQWRVNTTLIHRINDELLSLVAPPWPRLRRGSAR
jgi:hypothetical protein